MRKIALAMVLAATSVQAAEELKFGDLNYFLKTGEQNVSADISSTFSKQSVADIDSEEETRGFLLETRYGYGINDQLNVYLGLDYAYDREVEDKTRNNTPPADPKYDSNFNQDGLANPLLAANYRFMNQNTNMYNVDFGAVARINIEDAETGDAAGGESNDGNFADPRSSLELNARMGRKWNEANEWQLAAGLVYFNSGDYTVNDVNGDVDNEIESSTDLFLRASYQYRPVNEFMMLVSLQGTRVGEIDDEFNGEEVTLDSHIDFDFRFTAKYLITDNFIAKFNYGQGFYADYDVEDAEVDERRENFYGLGVEFLF